MPIKPKPADDGDQRCHYQHEIDEDVGLRLLIADEVRAELQAGISAGAREDFGTLLQHGRRGADARCQ